MDGWQKKGFNPKLAEKNFSTKGSTTAKGEGIGLNLLKRLYELHKSGMPIGDAVRILQNRLSDREQKALVIGIWRDLSEGLTLAKALSSEPGFSPLLFAMLFKRAKQLGI